MISFSKKFWQKVKDQGIVDAVLDMIDKAEVRKDYWKNLDWRQVKKTRLVDYIKENLKDINAKIIVEKHRKKIENLTYDELALYFEQWVIANIRYVTDRNKFGIEEYWEPISDVIALRNGDCESQATLLYCLLRHSGMPSNRLRLYLGRVSDFGQMFGHVWLQYRCSADGRWRIMDTTFYPDILKIENRANAYDDYRYADRWVGFNEERHFKGWK